MNTPERIRTSDLWFRKPTQTAVTPCKQRAPKTDSTYTRQNLNNALPKDPELAKLIEIWPNLSDEMKKAILKMTS